MNSGKYSSMLDLRGRNIVITGGLSGAGRTISGIFIECGGNVILTYNSSREAAERIRSEHPDACIRTYKLDQSSCASIENFAGRLAAESIHVDCLINNAGIYPAVDIDSLTSDDWDAMMDTNARGPFFLAASIRPLMNEGSSIINISSINASNPARKLAHYGISKAAVEMMTRCQAQAYGSSIRVNCIAPGLIYKEGQDEFIPGWSDSYRERSPLHRLVTAEDIGMICLFLASGLSGAITGQVITADCGITLAPCFYNDLD